MKDKYTKEYTIALNEAVHDVQTDSLIGLGSVDSVRIADSLILKGELANGKVDLNKQDLEIGRIIRFNYNEITYKLMILKVSKESVTLKIVEC
jgi:hypothetical protein